MRMRLKDKFDKVDVLKSCVCYLPLTNSAQECDANEFYDTHVC